MYIEMHECANIQLIHQSLFQNHGACSVDIPFCNSDDAWMLVSMVICFVVGTGCNLQCGSWGGRPPMRHLSTEWQGSGGELWMYFEAAGWKCVYQQSEGCEEAWGAHCGQHGRGAGVTGVLGTSTRRYGLYVPVWRTSRCPCATRSPGSRTSCSQVQTWRMSSGLLQDGGDWCTATHGGRGGG